MSENITVLIVDDDLDALEYEQIILEQAGYKVARAESRAEAEEWIAGGKPDIALVDLMMETPDAGFVLCHHIKKKYPATPIIMLTCVESETGIEFDAATREERSWVKADALLKKPVRQEQLLREMTRLLNP
ncbi:MAG TPA: response regulator [Oligoflexia bacterium]|nr:response regulator [Oligoflexia bacterium]